jgi:hypothetical protein
MGIDIDAAGADALPLLAVTRHDGHELGERSGRPGGLPAAREEYPVSSATAVRSDVGVRSDPASLMLLVPGAMATIRAVGESSAAPRPPIT